VVETDTLTPRQQSKNRRANLGGTSLRAVR
jgi:hypothetical protein